MRYVIFLSLILCGSLIHASSGHNKTPVYTVDALEVNWRWTWDDGWGANGQPIKIARINFCQIIYWEWIGKDWNKKAPRPGWKATGYTMYKIKKDKNNKNIRETENHQDKITYPRKNYHDGYWYVTMKHGFTTIQVRAKVLIGGLNGTDTGYDPESKDATARGTERHDPMQIHKAIMKSRQDAMKVRLARRSQEEDLPESETPEGPQEDLEHDQQPDLIPNVLELQGPVLPENHP